MEYLDKLRAKGVDDAELVWKILDQSPDCIKVLGLDGELEYMNPNGRKAMGIDDFGEVIGKKLSDMWPEESRPKLEAAICKALAGSKDQFEAYCPTLKGASRWWQVAVSPICDKHDQPTHILCTSRDITLSHEQVLRDAEAASEKSRDDAREQSHKVGNLLATISALARISLGPDGVYARERLMERIGKVSAAIGAAEPGSQTVTLDAIVTASLSQIADLPRFAAPTIADARLSGEAARTTALILGELESNALRHGALSGQGGTVSLSAERRPDGIAVTWVETLERAPTIMPGSGTGFRLVNRLSAMLPEPANFAWGTDRLVVTFTLPSS